MKTLQQTGQQIKRIVNSYWFMILLLTPFLVPLCFKYLAGLSVVYNVLKFLRVVVFAGVVAHIFYIFVRDNKLINHYLILVFALFALITISTISNKYSIMKPGGELVTVFSICYIVHYYIGGSNFYKFFNTLFYYYLLLHFINMVIIMFVPQGLTGIVINPMYFLAEDNTLAIHNILLMTLVFLKVKFTGNSLFYSCLFLPLTSAILVDSANNLVIVVLFIVVALASNICPKKLPNRFIMYVGGVGMLVMIGCVINRAFSDMVFQILGKLVNRDASFTGRTYLWDKALTLIENAPLIGYGDIYSEHISAWGDWFSSHNFYLEVLLDGGMFAFVAFFAVIAAIFYKLAQENGKLDKLFIVSIFVTLLYFFVQVSDQPTVLFIMFTLAFNCDKLNKYVYRNKGLGESLYNG